MRQNDIIQLAKDIIIGDIRLVIATLSIEEIKNLENTYFEKNLQIALKSIGMELVSMKIEEITDTSGYYEAKERVNETEQSFNDEFREIAQKAKIEEDEQEEIEQENNIDSVEETQEIQKVEEISTEEKISGQQYSIKNTQEEIDDIFASTRKYFEKNNSM